MKVSKIILTLTTMLLLSGCESELNIHQISAITGSNFWESPDDVEAYLIGTYSQYRDLTNTMSYGEERGDALTEGVRGGVSAAHKHTLSSNSNYSWENFYTSLHHCNMIIKYAPKISYGDESKKNRDLAEAYGLRARNFLTLLQMWGDVPIVLEPTESKEFKPSRSPKKEVMEQVMSDIETCLSLFPNDDIQSKYRLSRPAALMIKAEALAWNYTVLKSGDTKNLTDAIEALEEVEKCGVTLMENYSEVFDVDHRANQEIIFSLYLKFGEYDSMYVTDVSMNEGAGYINRIVNASEIVYSKGNIAAPHYAPSDELKALYSPDDNRSHVAYIEGLDAKGNILFTVENKFRGTLYTQDQYWDNDIVVYRLPDVQLLKAELLCYLGGDNVSKAIDCMTPVRLRAGIGEYEGSDDSQSVAKEILDERGRELFLELKRWPDLMRAHAAGTINLYEFVPNLKGRTTPLYFPIHNNMMVLNENLVQTEGY